MANKGVFPAADGDFNEDINIIIPYLNTAANKTRLVLTPVAQANLTSVSGLLTAAATGWNTLYPQSINPATNTTSITLAKNTLRTQIEKLLRAIYGDIPQSSLTQPDRDTLHLAARDTSASPVPVPANEPAIAIKQRAHLSVTLNITDPAHSHTQAKPEGVDAIEIESAFLAAGLPNTGFPKEADFRHVSSTGKFLFKRAYAMEQLAGTDFLRARYVNSRKQPGPWSDYVSVVVS